MPEPDLFAIGGAEAPAAPAVAAPVASGGSWGGDPAILAVLGGAGGDAQGQLAVASTIAHRQAALKAASAADVVTDPSQGYEEWQNAADRAKYQRLYPVGAPAYQAAVARVGPILSGQEPAPFPYTHYYGPAAQSARGRPPPKWDDGTGVSIGGNLFFTEPLGKGAPSPAEPDLMALGGGGSAAPEDGPTAQPRPAAIPTPVPASDNGTRPDGSVWDPSNGVWRAPTGAVLHVGDGPHASVAGARQITVPPGASSYQDAQGKTYTRDPKDPTRFLDATGADYRIVGSDQQSQSDVQAFLKAHPQDPGNHPQNYAPTALPAEDGADAAQFDRLGTGFVQGGMNVVHSLEGADAAFRANPVGNLLLTGASGQALQPGWEQADLARGVLTRNANDIALGNSGAYNIGKFGGEVAGTVPAMLATEGLGAGIAGAAGLADLGTGGSLLTRIPAAVGSSMAKGALYGGEGAALTSAGSSAPLGQQITQGAETGAVLNPLLTGGARVTGGIGRFVGNTVRPFLPGGAANIADQSLNALSGGVPLDLAEYVPGSKPTFAQALGADNMPAKTAAAVQQRTLMQEPGTNAPLAQTLSDADKARAAEVDSLTAGGDPAVINQMKAARDTVTAPLREAAFANKAPVDPTPVLQTIDQILASPAGQRDAVVSNLTKIRAKLASPVDTGGAQPVLQLQTDPEQLYGVRQAIDDQLSPLSDEKSGRLAARQLRQVQGALDPVIASGAPGFPAYMGQYAGLSRPINALEYLQSLNLGGNSGTPTLAGVNRAVTRLEGDANAPGLQDAKSLSDDQVQRVYNLQKDLQRADTSQALKYAARSPNTTGNLPNDNWVNALLTHPAASFATDVAGVVHPAIGFTLGAAKAGAQLGAGAVKRAVANRIANPESIQPFRPPPNKLMLSPVLSGAVGVAGGQTPANRFGF